MSEVCLDEDTFTMYGREGGRYVELVGEKRVEEYHILDKSTLKLKVSIPKLTLREIWPMDVPRCRSMPILPFQSSCYLGS